MPSLVGIACFLPGQAQDLPAPPRKWVTVHKFMQCNIPQDLDLQQHFCENPSSRTLIVTQFVKEFLAWQGTKRFITVLQNLSLLGVLSQVNPIHWRYVALLACNQDECDNAVRYLQIWREGKHLSLHDEISESGSFSYNESQQDALCQMSK